MSKLTKRIKEIQSKIEIEKLYPMTEALDLLKSLSSVKFVESVDISVNLGVDSKKSDQVVRGASTLPNGTGKSVRVAVFAQEGENADLAKEAGADIIGFDDLAAEIKKGNIDFDILIATPDSMRVVGQLGTILGPKGLMPNPKVGTVTTDVSTAVKNAKSGQVQFRTDKGGVIHSTVGKVSFESSALKENIEFLIKDLNKLKPASAKGIYLKKVTLSTTMGPGLSIDTSSIEV